MEKKIFEEPVIDVYQFKICDILTDSVEDGGNDDHYTPGRPF